MTLIDDSEVKTPFTEKNILKKRGVEYVRPKWDNLFWYQRASDEGKEQLENNTTKGFLKVLQETDDQLTTAFLNQFLDSDFTDTTFEYDVQVGVDEIPTTERTVHLVGLSYEGKNIAAEATPQSADGLVDGVISVQSDESPITIAIEVKTERDSLAHSQMGRYRGVLEIENDRRCHGVSWLDVFENFESHSHDMKEDVDRFLLTEFIDYLELMRMVPFRGFDPDKLSGPGSTEYKQELLRGVDQNQTGAFSQALYDKREDYNLGDFHAISNQQSREVHLADSEALEDYSFARLNHFSAGFWHAGRFSVQLYITRRVLGNITRPGDVEPDSVFVQLMKEVLQELEDVQLTTDTNPLLYIRYQRNIQQANDTGYDTTTFPTDSIVYAPGMTDESGIEERLSLIARSVREAENAGIGNEKSFVIEKQIPYSSDLIERKELVDYTLEYFETLLPVYRHFAP